jgi:hypothetical protein
VLTKNLFTLILNQLENSVNQGHVPFNDVIFLPINSYLENSYTKCDISSFFYSYSLSEWRLKKQRRQRFNDIISLFGDEYRHRTYNIISTDPHKYIELPQIKIAYDDYIHFAPITASNKFQDSSSNQVMLPFRASVSENIFLINYHVEYDKLPSLINPLKFVVSETKSWLEYNGLSAADIYANQQHKNDRDESNNHYAGKSSNGSTQDIHISVRDSASTIHAESSEENRIRQLNQSGKELVNNEKKIYVDYNGQGDAEKQDLEEAVRPVKEKPLTSPTFSLEWVKSSIAYDDSLPIEVNENQFNPVEDLNKALILYAPQLVNGFTPFKLITRDNALTIPIVVNEIYTTPQPTNTQSYNINYQFNFNENWNNTLILCQLFKINNKDRGKKASRDFATLDTNVCYLWGILPVSAYNDDNDLFIDGSDGGPGPGPGGGAITTKFCSVNQEDTYIKTIINNIPILFDGLFGNMIYNQENIRIQLIVSNVMAARVVQFVIDSTVSFTALATVQLLRVNIGIDNGMAYAAEDVDVVVHNGLALDSSISQVDSVLESVEEEVNIIESGISSINLTVYNPFDVTENVSPTTNRQHNEETEIEPLLGLRHTENGRNADWENFTVPNMGLRQVNTNPTPLQYITNQGEIYHNARAVLRTVAEHDYTNPVQHIQVEDSLGIIEENQVLRIVDDFIPSEEELEQENLEEEELSASSVPNLSMLSRRNEVDNKANLDALNDLWLQIADNRKKLEGEVDRLEKQKVKIKQDYEQTKIDIQGHLQMVDKLKKIHTNQLELQFFKRQQLKQEEYKKQYRELVNKMNSIHDAQEVQFLKAKVAQLSAERDKIKKIVWQLQQVQDEIELSRQYLTEDDLERLPNGLKILYSDAANLYRDFMIAVDGSEYQVLDNIEQLDNAINRGAERRNNIMQDIAFFRSRINQIIEANQDVETILNRGISSTELGNEWRALSSQQFMIERPEYIQSGLQERMGLLTARNEELFWELGVSRHIVTEQEIVDIERQTANLSRDQEIRNIDIARIEHNQARIVNEIVEYNQALIEIEEAEQTLNISEIVPDAPQPPPMELLCPPIPQTPNEGLNIEQPFSIMVDPSTLNYIFLLGTILWEFGAEDSHTKF